MRATTSENVFLCIDSSGCARVAAKNRTPGTCSSAGELRAYKRSITAQSLHEACREERGSRREDAEPVILVSDRSEVGPCRCGGGLEGLRLEDATDEVLISRVAKSGDRQALSELYDRYGNLIYGVGVRYLSDRTLAEDMVQDVFVSVWRSAAGFDPSKAGFSTWVHRIARNRAIDLARRHRARVQTVEPTAGEGTFQEPGEGDETEGILRAFDVDRVLSEIPPSQREVLVLAYFGGLSQREISRRTGIPLGTVKSRTTAALRAVRELMLAARTSNDPLAGIPKDRGSRDG
jgi:RNA polymerase sigma-70 factor (ECF subfamily)